MPEMSEILTGVQIMILVVLFLWGYGSLRKQIVELEERVQSTPIDEPTMEPDPQAPQISEVYPRELRRPRTPESETTSTL